MATLIPAIVVAIFGTSGIQPTPADIAWITSGEFCEPETVLPLPDASLLVSNVCDFRERGNGFLTLLDVDGSVLDWRILDDLDAPLGMTLVDGQLYVVDNNQVKIFHWPSYEPLRTILLDTQVANDLAVAADGTIYVSDTAGGLVQQVAPDGSQSMLTGEARFDGANGIELGDRQLFIGGERLWRLDLDSGIVTILGPAWLSDIDGIEIESDGTLQITPVGGPLIRYRSDEDIEIFSGDGISSANHGFSEQLNLALIPTGFDNTVIAIRIPKPNARTQL